MYKGFWLWILAVVVLIAGAFFLAAGTLDIYLDLASFALTIVLGILISFSAHSPREIAGYIRQSGQRVPLDTVQARRGIVYFTYLQAILIVFGIMFSIIGVIAVLMHLENPEWIYKGFSVSLITTLYSLLFSLLVTQPFIGALRARLARAGREAV